MQRRMFPGSNVVRRCPPPPPFSKLSETGPTIRAKMAISSSQSILRSHGDGDSRSD
ncbi:hypothetical protein CPAR01_03937 [Colletotrichum paranaense]|uniref:Uncharacterized protein n=1 Tax=Colletotrichum paranaense TaxID=1914294 RepID=A0ABQ9SUW6_9PEZI|nr:uncharacterized protein CPAR01_03937 [Colletotrichum paranaense]KAK1543304.1 hypothetical protein CPAR01_03937 [Colletotrichum paranaense]